jgi:hypothetical protein
MSSIPATQGGDNVSSPPPEENHVYFGHIVDQTVQMVKGDPCVILTIKPHERLRDPHDPSAGTEPCERQECDVRITLSADDDNRLRIAIRDLDRLGYWAQAGDDHTRLHPDHPDVIRLIGKLVYVRAKVIGRLTFWNLVWPQEKPKPIAVGDLQRAAPSLHARIAAARANGKTNASKSKTSPAPDSPPQAGR